MASNSVKTKTKNRRDPDRGARILEAARHLFYQRGFHAVSVDEIGEAAGATGAAIYRYFLNKEEILSTLFDAAQDRYMLAMPSTQTDPLAELELLVERHMKITLEQRELGSIWAHEHRSLTGEHERRVDRRTREYLNHWVSVLKRAFPTRSDRELRWAATAATGTTTSLISRPGRTISDAEADLVRRQIMAGLMALAEND